MRLDEVKWGVRFRGGDRQVQEGEGGVRNGAGEFEDIMEGVGDIDELFELLMGAQGSTDTVINIAEKKEQPTYVQDTTHALHLFQNLKFLGPQHLIFTMDFQSLSTQSPSTNTLIHLAELVLTINNFSFDSSHLTEGVAMGTRVGTSYACPFVGFVEQSHFNNYTGSIPHLLLRYIDDRISAALCSREELEQFINVTNTFHHVLKFTCTISDATLPFLDLYLCCSLLKVATEKL
eukprot:g44174.t1